MRDIFFSIVMPNSCIPSTLSVDVSIANDTIHRYNNDMSEIENGNSAHWPLGKGETNEVIAARIARIMQEFTSGFELIRNYPRSVSFFGSSRFTEHNEHYRHARTL